MPSRLESPPELFNTDLLAYGDGRNVWLLFKPNKSVIITTSPEAN